jgi:DNA-directed RNA polymerase specialized sigma24 family protein
MKKEWVLSQTGFDALLGWLDEDRDRAGRKYETVRLRLIKIFNCRGCSDAEELADETINRVIARIDNIAEHYEGEPLAYFYGVSQKVHLEYLRKTKLWQVDAAGDEVKDVPAPFAMRADEVDTEYECLERCLEHLPEDNRKLVLNYYQHERQAKIDHRKQLAAQMGIAVNALRIRAHRIRVALEECVHDCLQQLPAN